MWVCVGVRFVMFLDVSDLSRCSFVMWSVLGEGGTGSHVCVDVSVGVRVWVGGCRCACVRVREAVVGGGINEGMSFRPGAWCKATPNLTI